MALDRSPARYPALFCSFSLFLFLFTARSTCAHRVLNRWSSDYQALLRVVVGEAIGESKCGQIAVAWVIKNRVDDWRWPNSIRDVCYQPYQFECINNPNLNNLMNSYEAQVIDSWLPRVYVDYADNTGGANHHYAFKGSQGISPPWWARWDRHTIDIGAHRFYRL